MRWKIISSKFIQKMQKMMKNLIYKPNVRSVNYNIMKEKIRKEALEIIAMEGIDKLTMSMLAKRLELSKATFYYYYKSKEEILIDVFREGHRRLMKSGFSLDMKMDTKKLFISIAENWIKLLDDDDNYLFLRAISSLKLVNEDAKEEHNAIKLMLKSQAGTVSTKLETEKQNVVASLYSSLLFSLIDGILSEELTEDDMAEQIESFIDLIVI